MDCPEVHMSRDLEHAGDVEALSKRDGGADTGHDPLRIAVELSREAAAAGLVVTRLEPLRCHTDGEEHCFAITLWGADGALWAEGTHETAANIRHMHIAGYANHPDRWLKTKAPGR